MTKKLKIIRIFTKKAKKLHLRGITTIFHNIICHLRGLFLLFVGVIVGEFYSLLYQNTLNINIF